MNNSDEFPIAPIFSNPKEWIWSKYKPYWFEETDDITYSRVAFNILEVCYTLVSRNVKDHVISNVYKYDPSQKIRKSLKVPLHKNLHQVFNNLFQDELTNKIIDFKKKLPDIDLLPSYASTIGAFVGRPSNIMRDLIPIKDNVKKQFENHVETTYEKFNIF